MTSGSRASSAGTEAGELRSTRAAAPRSPVPVGGTLVGRARELDRLARGLVDVRVALICGVPGIGKSALVASCAAAWPGPAIRVDLAAGASIARLVDTVHRRLGANRSERAADAVAQLDGLWSLLDGAAALLVIDDLHCLPPAVRVAVLDTAARRLRAGRLVAASRERVPVGDGTPDRLQLRLDGLDRCDAAQLWERLCELYGPGGAFDAAWRRSLGHPTLLRHAHAATRSDEHPLCALVRSLDREPRRIAGALAVSQVALPRDVVLRVGAAPAAALDELVTRLIVDASPDAGYAMHDAMREAVLRELDAATRDELRTALVEALAVSERAAVTIVQESARHLRALGRHDDVAALLVSAGARLVRQGETAALLREIMLDDDPPAAGGPLHDLAAPAARRQLLRAEVRAVLRVACSADAPRAPAQLDVALPAGTDHAFDRAMLELARAVLAVRQDRTRRGAKHLEAAMRHAAECHADPGLIPALYDQLRSQAAAAARDGQASTPLPSLVIDSTRHEVMDGAVRVDLASRMVLRRLLYAFTSADGNYLDHTAICRALWQCDYAPMRHGSSIKSSVRRLRDLLKGTRAVIQTDEHGYRLSVPHGTVLVPPRR